MKLIVSAGKQFLHAKYGDIPRAISVLRYYSGWGDKNHGQTIEVRSSVLTKSSLSILVSS